MVGLRSFHEIWASMMIVGVSLWLLYKQLSYAFLGPLLIVVVFTFLATLTGPAIGRAQEAWLGATEARTDSTISVLNNVKVFKMLGFIENAIADIQALRAIEVRKSRAFRYLISVSICISNSIPNCATLIAFVIFAIISQIQGRDLDVTKLFASLTLLGIATEPIGVLIQAIPEFVSAGTCLFRIQRFLLRNELDKQDTIVNHIQNSSMTLANPEKPPTEMNKTAELMTILEHASFSWSTTPIVHDISLKIQHSKFYLIMGPVGSGKSTLLASLIGETNKTSGKFIPSSQPRAFCDQTPWLRSESIRDNILGILPYEENWYNTVVSACALVDDLAKFPGGDQIKVGSKGFAVSGGQKQKIALARALYSRAKFFVLDDILSGLDATSEEHIFTHVFSKGGVMDRLDATIVLVTHSHLWIQLADFLLLMEEGRIVEQDSPKDVKTSKRLALQNVDSIQHASETEDLEVVPINGDCEFAFRNSEAAKYTSSIIKVSDMEVYKTYLNSSGRLNMLAFILVICVLAAELNFQTVWLNKWASHGQGQVVQYISVYCGLVIFSSFLFLLFCIVLLCIVSPQSSRQLHKLQLDSVLRAPISLFATTETGSLVNRFTQDMMLIDSSLPFAMLNTFGNAIASIGSIVIIVIGAHYVGVAIPFLFAILWFVQKFYLRTSKQLRKLDLELKAPLFDHLLESMTGLATIRAFGWSKAFDQRNSMLLDHSQKPMFLLTSIQIWLGMILDLIIGLLVIMVTVLGVTLRASSDAGWVGLSLFNLIALGRIITSIVVNWTQLETSITAVARILQFAKTTPAEETETYSLPPPDCPAQGSVEFRNVSATHKLDSKDAIRNICLNIQPGEKLAICGRSGSGKTSLIETIFRLLEISKGRLFIGDLDTSTISRDIVRSKLAVMPQEPIYISGTIRHNLSPWSDQEDDRFRSVLQKVGMWDAVIDLGGLEAVVDMKKSLSHGQRQLFGLARALVKQASILVIDEGSSNMDKESDALMQKILRTELSGTTIIVVAHLLQTIIDFDRIVVMDYGEIVEYDSPENLLARPSKFKGLLDSSHFKQEAEPVE